LTTDPITDASVVLDGSTPVDAGLDDQLAALRVKAGRICDELAGLYRRMDELQRQIEAHQQR
jgi:uncharacterized coiled-coil protein SlyX